MFSSILSRFLRMSRPRVVGSRAFGGVYTKVLLFAFLAATPAFGLNIHDFNDCITVPGGPSQCILDPKQGGPYIIGDASLGTIDWGPLNVTRTDVVNLQVMGYQVTLQRQPGFHGRLMNICVPGCLAVTYPELYYFTIDGNRANNPQDCGQLSAACYDADLAVWTPAVIMSVTLENAPTM